MFDNFNYSTRKKISPFSVFIISLILVIIISAVIAIIANNMMVNANVSDEQTDTTVSTVYYVKEYDGKIAVFTDLTKPPVEITDTQVFTFPQADIDLLMAGIKVDSEKELKRLLEDYCS